jgi:hypothetical protein
MIIERRTMFAALGAVLAWAFFFVPNELFSFLRIQGNERLPTVALFGIIPVIVGIALCLMLGRRHTTTALITIGLPLLGIAASVVLWLAGYYSSESLLGAWFYCLSPIPAYALGVLVGLWLRARPPSTAS